MIAHNRREITLWRLCNDACNGQHMAIVRRGTWRDVLAYALSNPHHIAMRANCTTRTIRTGIARSSPTNPKEATQ